jgi:hypothetical protein
MQPVAIDIHSDFELRHVDSLETSRVDPSE